MERSKSVKIAMWKKIGAKTAVLAAVFAAVMGFGCAAAGEDAGQDKAGQRVSVGITEELVSTPQETDLPTGSIAPPSGYEGPMVVIDAGHQGPGQDMSGTEPNGPGSSEMKARIVSGTTGRITGLAEYELNLNVALLLQEELLQRGYQVVMTRDTHDVNLSNIDRASIANESGADIMVRIHANGVDDTSVDGALCMVPSASNPYVGDLYGSCSYLGQCIVDAYCEATGLANDGLQEVDNMTGINWSRIPVTIIEMGFMTNEGDDLYMADEENQRTMALGIADGIDRYFQGEMTNP